MPASVTSFGSLRVIRADPRWTHLPVLILTASDDREHRREALDCGATDFLLKPIDAYELLPRVRNAPRLKKHHDALEARVEQRTAELARSQSEVVHCLARAAESRDGETGAHVIRVGRYVGILSKELGLDAETCRLYEQASVLHDVGKIGISDAILLKPGKFTPAEFQTMKSHAEIGRGICGYPVQGDASQTPPQSKLLQTAGVIAWTHHEKFDGSGYPLGLAGEEIPLCGRITAVADVFDALSSRRPYKEAFVTSKCFDILRQYAGSHFDPQVIDAFFSKATEILQVREAYADHL